MAIPVPIITSLGGMISQSAQYVQGSGVPGNTVYLVDETRSRDGSDITDFGTAVVGNDGIWGKQISIEAPGSHLVAASYSRQALAEHPDTSSLPHVTYLFNNTAPTLTAWGEVSNLLNHPDRALAGNVITQYFTLDPAVSDIPVVVDQVTINGQPASLEVQSPSHYAAHYTVQTGDANGPALVEIQAHDLAGNAIDQTLGGQVTVDSGIQAVPLTPWGETSNNADNSAVAKPGDVITQFFTIDPEPSGDLVTVDQVTIGPGVATVVETSPFHYMAQYAVQADDPGGPAVVEIKTHDPSGNPQTSVLTGHVTIEAALPSGAGYPAQPAAAAIVSGETNAVSHVAPTLTPWSEESNLLNHPDHAFAGNVITQYFTVDPVSEDLPFIIDQVTINGQVATIEIQSPNHFAAHYTVQSGDANGPAFVEIHAHDLAGNVIDQSMGGKVTVDSSLQAVPLTPWGETSSNPGDSTIAKPGDVITQFFTIYPELSGDRVTVDQVTIGPGIATVVETSPFHYMAQYTVQTGDPGGPAVVEIKTHDPTGNPQTSVLTGHVTIEAASPAEAAPEAPAFAYNHAPTITTPLESTVVRGGLQPLWDRLTQGASDLDANDQIHVTDLTFSIDGGPASSAAPAGITLANEYLQVNPNDAAFAHLGAGQHETIVASYHITDDHGGSVAQTDTITIVGAESGAPNHAPTVAQPMASTLVTGTQPLWVSLLSGASDVDANNYLHATDLSFSVNGGAPSSALPAGVQVANDMILVNQNDPAYAGLHGGQLAKIVASYNITDGHGGIVAQTDTITITGPAESPAVVHNHAPTVAQPLSATLVTGTQPLWSSLLAGASDADANPMHVSDLTFSINGGAAIAATPAGVQVANDMILVNQNDAAFAGLKSGQSATIVANYHITDSLGGSVAQTDTITVTGAAAPSNAVNMAASGVGLIATANADTYVYGSLSGAPVDKNSGAIDTIVNFNAAAGDRIDLSAILSASASVHSTVNLNQYGQTSTELSIMVGGTEYYIAKLPGQQIGVPDALASAGSGTGLDTALHGASWTDTVDVTSAHGGPASVTAAAGATVNGATTNATGDWTMQVVSGTATENAALHQLIFSTPASANEVIIHTADNLNHDLTNVNAIQWHA